MTIRRAASFGVLALILVAAVVLLARGFSGTDLFVLLGGTPHDRYALSLKLHRLSTTDAGRRWSATAEESLASPRVATLAGTDRMSLNGDAVAFAIQLRRGQRYIASVRGQPAAVLLFVDLFFRGNSGPVHVESAGSGNASLDVEASHDGAYIVRIQPVLGAAGDAIVAHTIQPSLALPVEGVTASAVKSGFGAERDEGRRRHEGVDIFAPRGTRVLAASDGIVSVVGTNPLGGNVVWQLRPLRGESLYYAHLDTQLVKAGAFVRRGDVLGTVGNTGNARGGPPHLHFGVYAVTEGGAVDPAPYLTPLHTRASRRPFHLER